jgi:glucokinase
VQQPQTGSHAVQIGIQAVRGLEASLIHHLRADRNLSRVDLARRMKLAPSTIGQYVDRLIGAGFVQEGAKALSAAGRPPTVLELNPRCGQFVGLDFEGRQVLASAVDFAQQPLGEFKLPFRSRDRVGDVLEKLALAVRRVAVKGRRLLGIGVGVPGALDQEQGIGLHYEFIPGWRNIPIRDEISKMFQVPVHIENNVRVMALAEQLFGAGRGLENFICIGIRSGIGAGIVVDGELFRGQSNLAGEIGGWPVDGDQTLEQLASCTALVRAVAAEMRAGRASSLSSGRTRPALEGILAAAAAGDSFVLDFLKRSAELLGRVIAQMNLVLDPQNVILSGPLAELTEAFVVPVQQAVSRLALPPHAAVPRVVGSGLGEFSGALGGAALAVRSWEPIVHSG